MSLELDLQEFLGEFFTDDGEDYFKYEASADGAMGHSQADRADESKVESKAVPIANTTKPLQKVPIGTNDVKRSYTKQFETGINLHDKEKFLRIIQGFCVPDLVGTVSYPRGNPHGVSYRELTGVEVIADYLCRSFSSVPDSLMFIHDTQLIGYENGTALIVSKFSISGSRLFTVTAEVQGQKLPEPPAVRILHNAVGKANLTDKTKVTASVQAGDGGSEDDLTSALDADSLSENIKAIKQSVTFKEGANKFDRYKKQKVNTLGAYVTYKEFSETSLKGKKSTSTAATAHQLTQQQELEQEESHSVGVSSALSYLDSGNSTSGVPVHRGSNSSSTLKAGFHDDDVMIAGAGSEIKFGHSELLQQPAKVNLYGIQKFHTNSDNKVYRMEWIVAFRNNDS